VADKYFIDSNIALYAVDDEDWRTEKARALIFGARPVISVQVLNEFINIARKKFKLANEEIALALSFLKSRCEVIPLTLDIHDKAFEIFSATNFGIYDANIIAAADLAGCEVLYSEDMSHGQRVGRVVVRNPFM
jgi:predicted nucleic acid-binding protein